MLTFTKVAQPSFPTPEDLTRRDDWKQQKVVGIWERFDLEHQGLLSGDLIGMHEPWQLSTIDFLNNGHGFIPYIEFPDPKRKFEIFESPYISSEPTIILDDTLCVITIQIKFEGHLVQPTEPVQLQVTNLVTNTIVVSWIPQSSFVAGQTQFPFSVLVSEFPPDTVQFYKLQASILHGGISQVTIAKGVVATVYLYTLHAVSDHQDVQHYGDPPTYYPTFTWTWSGSGDYTGTRAYPIVDPPEGAFSFTCGNYDIDYGGFPPGNPWPPEHYTIPCFIMTADDGVHAMLRLSSKDQILPELAVGDVFHVNFTDGYTTVTGTVEGVE